MSFFLGTTVISISFPEYPAASHLNVDVQFDIVMFSSILARAVPYTGYVGNYIEPGMLEKIHCSEIFQRAEMIVIAYASDGSYLDITSHEDVVLLTLDSTIAVVEKPIIVASNYGKDI